MSERMIGCAGAVNRPLPSWLGRGTEDVAGGTTITQFGLASLMFSVAAMYWPAFVLVLQFLSGWSIKI